MQSLQMKWKGRNDLHAVGGKKERSNAETGWEAHASVGAGLDGGLQKLTDDYG